MKTDPDRKIAQVLDQVFGPAFEIASVPAPARFVFEHPQKVANEALAAARGRTCDGRYQLMAGFYRSGQLNAGALELDAATGAVGISAALPLALLHAVSIVIPRMDVSTLMPARAADGRFVVYPQRRNLMQKRVDRTSVDVGSRLTHLLTGLRESHLLPVALLLYDLSIRFVVMHECMHILLGHAGFVQRKLGMAALMELGTPRRRTLASPMSQALEFIADRHAVRGVAAWARGRCLGDYVEAMPRAPQLALSAYLQRALVLALLILLRLFPARRTLPLTSQGSHPHPYARMRWLAREICADLASVEEAAGLVLEPIACWNASFEHNFLAPGNWGQAIAQDQSLAGNEAPLTDRAYADITAAAGRWQSELWQTFAPHVPGDGRAAMPAISHTAS